MPKIVIAILPPPSPTNECKLPALQLHRTNLSFYQIIFMSTIKLITHPWCRTQRGLLLIDSSVPRIMIQNLQNKITLRAEQVMCLTITKYVVVSTEADVFSVLARGMLWKCPHTATLYETSQSIQPFFVERSVLSDYTRSECSWRDAYWKSCSKSDPLPLHRDSFIYVGYIPDYVLETQPFTEKGFK